MVIGLIAAKKGLNSVTLMKELSESIYNEYNGFNGALQDGEQQDLSMLPSNMLYDWQKIDRIHKKKEIEDAKIIKDTDNSNQQSSKESTINTITSNNNKESRLNQGKESVKSKQGEQKEGQKGGSQSSPDSDTRKILTELIGLKRLNG